MLTANTACSTPPLPSVPTSLPATVQRANPPARAAHHARRNRPFAPRIRKAAKPKKVGDEARIKLDGLDAVFPAKISFIATEAQFTPKNVETANERAKLMFKVKLRIPKETALQYKGLLKGGMVGNGYVRTNGQQAWSADLAVKLPQF